MPKEARDRDLLGYCSLCFYLFNTAEPRPLLALHLVALVLDKPTNLFKFRDDFELQRVHPPPGPFDLVEQVFDPAFEFGACDDCFEEIFVGISGIIDD